MNHIPMVVMALSAQVRMHPIAWKEDRDTVVIVFQEGPKVVFSRALARLPGEQAPAVGTTRPAARRQAQRKG